MVELGVFETPSCHGYQWNLHAYRAMGILLILDYRRGTRPAVPNKMGMTTSPSFRTVSRLMTPLDP